MNEESGGGHKPTSIKPPTIKPPTAFETGVPPPAMSMPAPMQAPRPPQSAPPPMKQKSSWALVVLLFLAIDVLIVLGLLFYFWGR